MDSAEQKKHVLDTALGQVPEHWNNDLGRKTIIIRIPIYFQTDNHFARRHRCSRKER